jgi:hypothetical protein
MNRTNDEAVDRRGLDRHLLRMRLTMGVFLATVPVAVIVAIFAEHRRSAIASPLTMTLVAVAASLWIGLSANRDARDRLERTKRAFAVHGDERKLLRDHWWVYVMVLLRLEVMVLCGVMIALRGLGPGTATWLLLVAAVMIALTWPTLHKTRLLLERARDLREF